MLDSYKYIHCSNICPIKFLNSNSEPRSKLPILQIALKWTKFIKIWPLEEKSSKKGTEPTFKKAHFSSKKLQISEKCD